MEEMTYSIHGWSKETNKFELLPISTLAYHDALAAKAHLVNFVAIEDTFDQFIENYLEYESDVLRLAQRQLVQSAQNWSAAQLDTQKLNRRIVNMLSSARLYQEFVERITDKLQNGGGSVRDQWKAHRSAQYNRLLGHRAMETLRNYVQHQAPPITRVTSSGGWTDGREHLLFTVIPLVRVRDLARASQMFSKGGKRVVAELEAIADLIPLTPLIREYVEGLGLSHEALRELLREYLMTSETTCKGILNTFREKHGAMIPAVNVVAINDAGQLQDRQDIFEDIWLHYHILASKNRMFDSFSRRYATGHSPLTGHS